MNRTRQFAINALLVVGSTAFTFLIVELLIFRIFLAHVSLNFITYLPDIAGVLVQRSISGLVPRDYIALLGDSYAEGLGDWLWEARGNRTKPYHSGNVIHDATGRDVVSFGKGGNSTAEGMVRSPARIFAGMRCAIFPDIEPPRQIFHYYYEGNDPGQDLMLLPTVQKHYGHAGDDMIDRYLAEILSAVSPWRCHAHLIESLANMTAFIYIPTH